MKHFLRRWLIPAAVSLPIGIAAVEACLRLSAVFSPPVVPVIGDPLLNHVWNPGVTVEHTEHKVRGVPPYTHHYNAQSWIADYDIQETKPAGAIRIFMVGDSFVEGTCPMDRNAPAVLAAHLREHGRFEVINTGTGSYSPVLYYLLLTSRIVRYHPDIVVINVDMSDVFDDFLYRQSAQMNAQGQMVAVPAQTEFSRRYRRTMYGIRALTAAERAFRFFSPYLLLARRLGGSMEVLNDGTIPPRRDLPALFDWCREPWDTRTAESVSFSMEMLRKSLWFLKENKITVILSAVPHLEQFDGRFSLRPLAEVQRIAEEESVPYFDLYAALRAKLGAEMAQRVYLRGDMHFNELGYKIWGAALSEFMSKTVLVHDG